MLWKARLYAQNIVHKMSQSFTKYKEATNKMYFSKCQQKREKD